MKSTRMRLFMCIVWINVMLVAQVAAADVQIQYEEAQTKRDAVSKGAIQQSGVVEYIAGYVNEQGELPVALTIRFTSKEDGMFYDSAEKSVVVSYAFWDECISRYKKEQGTEELSDEMLFDIGVSVLAHGLLHEVGHALIDVYSLPITGNEENAADEFATLALLDGFEQGLEMALIAGDYFALEGLEVTEVTDQHIFDEHSLDDQRAFNITCLAYGISQDELLRQEMLEWEVPEERVNLCIEDAERRVQAWDTLLSEFSK